MDRHTAKNKSMKGVMRHAELQLHGREREQPHRLGRDVRPLSSPLHLLPLGAFLFVRVAHFLSFGW